MMSKQYVEFKELHHWQDTTVVLVDVFPDNQAYVRSFIGKYVSKELPIGEALQRAAEFALLEPHTTSVAVYLEEGATWNEAFGSLIPWVPSK